MRILVKLMSDSYERLDDYEIEPTHESTFPDAIAEAVTAIVERNRLEIGQSIVIERF